MSRGWDFIKHPSNLSATQNALFLYGKSHSPGIQCSEGDSSVSLCHRQLCMTCNLQGLASDAINQAAFWYLKNAAYRRQLKEPHDWLQNPTNFFLPLSRPVKAWGTRVEKSHRDVKVILLMHHLVAKLSMARLTIQSRLPISCESLQRCIVKADEQRVIKVSIISANDVCCS